MSKKISTKPLTSGMMVLGCCMIPFFQATESQLMGSVPEFQPPTNSRGLRGLSMITSAEPMGAGRITFSFFAPWYHQSKGYLNTPNVDADIFTGTGAFSFGVNSHVDLFTSISGFSTSNYTRDEESFGLGSIEAGVQGSLPLPRYAPLRLGAQTAIIGGTSRNQINTYRADGYNYFETRRDFDLMGKLLQTLQVGGDDYGFKAHLNEGGVIGLNTDSDALLLLGAGLQANLGYLVLGAELNSRTQFNKLAFETDPLWVTPTVHIRTPYPVNGMAGVDISLSADRDQDQPRALEPYRVFISIAFSIDMLAGKREAELQRQRALALEKISLTEKADSLDANVQSLTEKGVQDSLDRANEQANSAMQMDSAQQAAEILARKATADSLALIQAASNLADERNKRSDAEKKLLSTGELLLDAVYFESGKAIISINSKPYLNIIAKMLVKYPKLRIEVAGHTDNQGAAQYNLTLSQDRAAAVRDYLSSEESSLRETLSAKGYGITMPKADNNTADGRLSNRRVELRVTNTQALQEYNGQ